MCSLFMPTTRMENFQGDLTDILRAGTTTATVGADPSDHQEPYTDSWHFPYDPMIFPSSSSAMEEEEETKDNFGDPFLSYMRDPLLNELDISSSSLFSSPNCTARAEEGVTTTTFGSGGDGSHHVLSLGHHNHQSGGVVVDGDPIKRPYNIFSRMLQISPSAKVPVSPCDSPVMGASVSSSTSGVKTSSASAAMVASDMIINGNSSSAAKGCLLENTGMQISSPRNPGIKRSRKSQAKKVVCIPAPAAANSRPTGEVVPSDLWAWRKYGQKPIKGSPYPRGYYRCSSSKGCSARKQVERSRTDPNMLVITYTSEHNHPWPTQRNALAGSTRSQPSKKGGAAALKISPDSSHQPHLKPTSPTKKEQNENVNDNDDNHMSPTVITAGSASTVKEEFEDIEKQLELDHHHQQLGFAYRPSMPDEQSNQSHHPDDFFADLGEIEADPLNLLFSQCFSVDEQQQKGGKVAEPLDPFNLLDNWSGDHNTNNTSFAEAKRRL
ncbi:probable WRKY transcription factor 14 isoform X1 [Pyrus x bretschneideri]|uniref:probable WRKY transcription factor 14 isoform X1 n=1 Tax=Pyrus x bretschneideri TaxID=225117 RepID=UPI00202F60DA|nr:probable WRKY transcription factor 14 isoform X1 [Pyrus x bretschneideri]